MNSRNMQGAHDAGAKKKKLLLTLIFFSLFAAVFAVQNFWIAGRSLFGDNPYELYLTDLRIGFISRAFIGSLVTLLVHPLTAAGIDIFILVSFILMVALLSFTLALLCCQIEKRRFTEPASVLCAAVLIAPCGLMASQVSYGFLDCYLIIVFCCGVLMIVRGRGLFLLPLVCFIGLFIHYSFLFTYLPALIVMILYEALTSQKLRKTRLCALVTIAVSLLGCVYFFVFANKTVTMTYEEVTAWMSARIGREVSPFLVFSYIYREQSTLADETTKGVYNIFQLMWNNIRYVNIGNKGYAAYIFKALKFLSVMAAPFLLWCVRAKKSAGRCEKAVFALFALTVFTLPAFALFSTDTERGCESLFVCQLVLCLYLLLRSDPVILDIFDKSDRRGVIPFVYVIFSVLCCRL